QVRVGYHQKASMQPPPDLLIGTLISDNLPVENEETVCQAAELWLELNTESPSRYFST
ncbi:hypothetical protein DBR06_SOUSAS8210072, partial [Sousa chinensis]